MVWWFATACSWVFNVVVGLQDSLGKIGVFKDLVVVVVTRSAWLWVCESDLVVGGDGFTNRFWSWVWG